MNSTFLRLAVIALTAAPFTSGGMAQDAPPHLAVTLNALANQDASTDAGIATRTWRTTAAAGSLPALAR